MFDLNNINMDQFQKCGEVMVSSKRNKVVVICNFCQQKFKHLQSFMRHLQLQHNDILQFINQAKAVEVYSVEELMNQTLTSCVPNIETDESNLVEEDVSWLNKVDMDWLDNGVEPMKLKQHDKHEMECEEEQEGLGMANVSILKAFENCDVSFSLMDNLYNTKCLGDEEGSNILNNSLLLELQNDWEDSGTNGSVPNSVDCTNTKIIKLSKHVVDIDKDFEENITIRKSFLSYANVEENLNATNGICENSSNSCIKSHLQEQEHLHDVDNVMENLENSITSCRAKNVDELKVDITQNFNTRFFNQDTKAYESFNNNFIKNQNINSHNKTKVLLNTKLIPNFNKQNASECLVMKIEMPPKNSFDNIPKNLENFEKRLRELEASLDEDIANSDGKINQKRKETTELSINKFYKHNNFEFNFKDKEDKSYNDCNAGHDNNMISYPDLQKQINDFDECVNEKKNNTIAESLEEKNSNVLSETTLNQDLTKALADALDDDLDLLNIDLENESEDPLNEDILNLLERELEEKECDHKENHSQGGEIKIEEKQVNESLKKQRASVDVNESNSKIKFQKTNLKARKKFPEKQNKYLLTPIKSLVLKQSNTINYDQISTNLQNPFKGNRDILLHQQQITSLKIPMKTISYENICEKTFSNFRHRKSLNKENLANNAPALNILKIKKEKITPTSNFINFCRGEKTPVKRLKIFLKQSPKTQEKQQVLIKNLTPKGGERTPPERKIKLSPKTEGKQQHAQSKIHQKPPELKNKGNRKRSSETNEQHCNNKSSKILRNNNISKQQINESPLKCEKSSSNTKRRINSFNSCNDTKNPLTTPQRLRNVAIKLHRLTPDKFANVINREKISMEVDGKQLAECVKIPKGISLKIVPSEASSLENKGSQIVENPVKASSHYKQNFTESSLEITQPYEIKKLITAEIKPRLIEVQREITTNTQPEQNCLKLRQRKASIDMLPPSKQHTKMCTHRTPRNSNLGYESYAAIRSSQKKEVLQRMRNIKKQIFKSIEESERVAKGNNMISPPMKQPKKEKLYIENIKVLPNLDNKLIKNAFNTTTANKVAISPEILAEVQKQLISLEKENVIMKTLKRKASTPLSDEIKYVKRQQETSVKDQKENVAKITDLEATELGLSESVVDFLQRDLKANRINFESLLNDNLIQDDTSVESNDIKIEEALKDDSATVINDLLKQVDNEQIAKEIAQRRNSTVNNHRIVDDFNDAKDISLLSKFGLKIIKLPEIEDLISLEERDDMSEKAIQFANIYKRYPRIWTTKNGESRSLKEDFDNSFNQLLAEIKTTLHLDLSMVELKRLVNLINFWYAQNFSSKLIEKRRVSDSTNRYLHMFLFIPKTIKRFYHCEYCDEYFNTEHKYFTHRIIHTGALHAYECRKCIMGFRSLKQLKNHESSCNLIVNIEKYAVKTSPNNYIKSNTRCNKCPVCAKIFSTSEVLYEHSKTHLKTIYNCGKCELVFASAQDVQNHMVVCNPVTKCMPKQSTPRLPKNKI